MLEGEPSLSDTLLRALVEGRTTGSFEPFATGREAQLEAHIEAIVGRLRENQDLLVEADFASYGSGYASYVPVTISKADKSDTVTYATSQRVEYKTQGMLLYISRLAPYWYYGANTWTKQYAHGKYTGGSSTFLEPADVASLDGPLWASTERWLESVLAAHGYELLTQQAVSRPAPKSITTIPTILAAPPYRVFDCFFYWED